MKKVYWLLKLKVRFLATLLLCTAAVYVVGGRFLFMQLSDHQSDLEAILSAVIDRPVTMESIEGHWSGFDPVIQFNHLTIGGERLSTVEIINFRLSLWSSLLAQDVRVSSLEFLNTSFDAVQNKKTWSFAGVEIGAAALTGNDGADDAVIDEARVRQWFDGASVSFVETKITVYSKRGDVRDWRFPGISLRYQGDDIYASGQIVQPGSLSPLMSISVHGSGALSDARVRSEVYLEARSVDFLDAVLRAYDWQGIAVSGIDASGRLWADFEGATLLNLQGDVQVSRLSWDVNDVAQAPVRKLATRFRWRQEQKRWNLEFNDLAWRQGERRCDVGDGYVQRVDSGSEIYLDQLDVGCINELVLAADLPEGDLFDRLDISRPEGYLKAIDLRLFDTPAKIAQALPIEMGDMPASELPAVATDTAPELSAEARELTLQGEASVDVDAEGAAEVTIVNSRFSSFTLEAMLDAVAVSAYESTPSIEGLYGYVSANDFGGDVLFSSNHFELGFPTLFARPWQLSSADGSVSWRIDEEDVSVYSDGLRLDIVGSGYLYGDFSLDLNSEQREDLISLAIAFQDVPFPKVPELVPAYEVSAGLYDWLGDAFKGGVVGSGIYYGYGSVETVSADNSYTSSLLANTVDAELIFDPEWPGVEGLDARVELQNDALSVVATKAEIHGTTLSDLVVTLPSVPDDQEPVLDVSANTSVKGRGLRYWLMESPIADNLSAVGEQLEVGGNVGIDLKLSVPFDDRDIRYGVDVTLDGNRVKHVGSDLLFEEVSGAVNVDWDKGVVADSLSLRLFDYPAKIEINSHAASGGVAPYIAVALRAKSDVDRLLTHFGLSAVPGIAGVIDYSAELDIFDSDTSPRLSIASDLVGMSRDLPSPYDKAMSTSESLKIEVDFLTHSTEVNADLSSDRGTVDANFLFDQTGLNGVDVLLGDVEGRSYETPGRDGVTIHGVVPEANLDEIVRYIDSFPDQGSAKDSDIKWRSIDLGLDVFRAGGQSFNGVTLSMFPGAMGWTVNILGDDIAGKLALPSDVRNLSLDLDYVHFLTPDVEVAPGLEPPREINPKDMPPFSFSTKAFVLNGHDYGAWSAVAEPDESTLKIDKLKGVLGGVEFKGGFTWNLESGQPSTHVRLTFEGTNSEDFFNALDVAPPLSSKVMVGDVDLSWQGHPYEYDPTQLYGTFGLKMEDGFLKTSDTKTGALRFLGVFNADAIERRLKLDFSDLYTSGVGYDELIIRAQIDEGVLNFKDPMTISGPSSRYEVSGSTDLDEQTLDLDMRVELPFSSNVPIAALILGAPAVGGAVWLVDKILGSPLSSMTALNYEITGTWKAPKMDVK